MLEMSTVLYIVFLVRIFTIFIHVLYYFFTIVVSQGDVCDKASSFGYLIWILQHSIFVCGFVHIATSTAQEVRLTFKLTQIGNLISSYEMYLENN